MKSGTRAMSARNVSLNGGSESASRTPLASGNRSSRVHRSEDMGRNDTIRGPEDPMQRMVRSIFIALIGFSMVSTAHPAVTASKEKLISELLALTHADRTPDAVLDILGGRLGLPPVTGAQGKVNQIEIYDRYFAEQD